MNPTPNDATAPDPESVIAEESQSEEPKAKGQYLRVIFQLLLILPCAVLLIPTFLLCLVGVAEMFRGEMQSRSLLTIGSAYFLGFGCMAYGVFLPDHPRGRLVGILVALAGLPLFTASALALISRFQGLGVHREIYEIIAIFGGPIIVAVWNVIRIAGLRKDESKGQPDSL